METMIRGEKLDAPALLAEVDRQEVLRALKRSKQGLPRPVPYTEESMEEEHLARMPQREKEKLWDIYDRLPAMKGNCEGELAVLFAMREKYPRVPVIYNYISVVYQNTGQWEKLAAVLDEIKNVFPDYLFGKTALAEYYLHMNDLGRIPSVLNHHFELHLLYPERTLFHISEVRAFYGIVGQYHTKRNHLARAIACYYLLEGISPEHPMTLRLANAIVGKELDNLRQKMRPVNKTRDFRPWL